MNMTLEELIKRLIVLKNDGVTYVYVNGSYGISGVKDVIMDVDGDVNIMI